MRRSITITLERDSVCAADDVLAPHPKSVTLHEAATVADLLKKLSSFRYLPLIEGGHATWTLESKIPLAVVAQEWREPRALVDPSMPVVPYLDGSKVVFRYFAQESPDAVFERQRTKG